MRFNTGVLCGISCIELSRVLRLHITTQYMVRLHSLRYGYTDHPFGSECPNILHNSQYPTVFSHTITLLDMAGEGKSTRQYEK